MLEVISEQNQHAPAFTQVLKGPNTMHSLPPRAEPRAPLQRPQHSPHGRLDAHSDKENSPTGAHAVNTCLPQSTAAQTRQGTQLRGSDKHGVEGIPAPWRRGESAGAGAEPSLLRLQKMQRLGRSGRRKGKGLGQGDRLLPSPHFQDKGCEDVRMYLATGNHLRMGKLGN